MAEAPSLGDFFKSKGKKKIKASNLNKDTTTPKPEEKKATKKSTEDDAWEEEQVDTQTMKVAVAGKLPRDEEKKDDEDTSGPVWANISKEKKEAPSGSNIINEKKFPTLAKSVGNINIDDGADAKVNISTSKNHFAALEGDEDDDEDTGKKRPKEITPAMVSKKKGEREKDAVEREVHKYTKKKDPKKKAKPASGEDDEEDEDEEEAPEGEEDDAEEEAEEKEGKKKKVPEKKEERKDDKKAQKPARVEEEEEELEEDLKIQPDEAAAKEKYKGRKKLPPQDLPRSELQEEKENKQKQAPSGKKKKFVNEEETEKKLVYVDR